MCRQGQQLHTQAQQERTQSKAASRCRQRSKGRLRRLLPCCHNTSFQPDHIHRRNLAYALHVKTIQRKNHGQELRQDDQRE